MKFRLWSRSTRSQCTRLLVEHALLLPLVFTFWLQESWHFGGSLLYEWDHLASHTIKYYKTLLLQGLKLGFWHIKLHQKVNIWFCFAARFMQRVNQYHQAMRMHLSNYLELFVAAFPLPVVEYSDFYLCRIPSFKPVKGQTKCWPSCSSGLCTFVGKETSLFRNLCWPSKGAWLLTSGKRHNFYQQLV